MSEGPDCYVYPSPEKRALHQRATKWLIAEALGFGILAGYVVACIANGAPLCWTALVCYGGLLLGCVCMVDEYRVLGKTEGGGSSGRQADESARR